MAQYRLHTLFLICLAVCGWNDRAASARSFANNRTPGTQAIHTSGKIGDDSSRHNTDYRETAKNVEESQSNVGVRVGRKFTSPDGRFTVRIVVKSQDSEPTAESTYYTCYEITDRKAGAPRGSVPTGSLVYKLFWSNDSKAVICLEHMSGGPYIQLLRFEGQAWSAKSYEAPATGLYHSGVLKVTAANGGVDVTWGANRRVDHLGKPDLALRFIQSHIDLKSGDQVFVKESSVTDAVYDKMKNEFEAWLSR